MVYSTIFVLVVKGIFKKSVCIIPFGGPHAWWYWCIFWVVEHEVAWRGFPNNPTLDEVVHGLGQRLYHPICDYAGAWFNAFIEPYVSSGARCLIGHTKGHKYRLYMHNNCIPTIHYKIRCTMRDWSLPKGLFVWHTDEEAKMVYWTGIQNLANQHPWRMWRIS